VFDRFSAMGDHYLTWHCRKNMNDARMGLEICVYHHQFEEIVTSVDTKNMSIPNLTVDTSCEIAHAIRVHVQSPRATQLSDRTLLCFHHKVTTSPENGLTIAGCFQLSLPTTDSLRVGPSTGGQANLTQLSMSDTDSKKSECSTGQRPFTCLP
jgi:hypothetical protein